MFGGRFWVVEELMKEGNGTEAFDAGRNTIDSIRVTTKIGEVETDSGETGQHLLEEDGLRGGETDSLREEHLLRGCGVVLQLLHVTLVTDTDIGPVLIDDHQTRLDGGHDVATLVLVVRGRCVELRIDS